MYAIPINVLSTTEHETLVVGAHGGAQLSVSEAERLDQAQKRIGILAFTWTSRQRIKIAHFVGVLAAGNIILEVLPKTGLPDENGARRRILLRMIARSLNVKLHDGEISSHEYADRHLLELLIGLFARRLVTEMRRGVFRGYTRVEEVQSRMRGKLNVIRQFTVFSVTPNRLAVEYDEFSADVVLNRILLSAALLLRQITTSAAHIRLLDEITMQLNEVEAVTPDVALNYRLEFTRQNQRWASVISIARMFLRAQYQTPHVGSTHGIAFLFDMNRLFESYVFSLARKALAPLGFELRSQGPRLHLAHHLVSGDATFQLRPDVWAKSEDGCLILDAKWKHISLRNGARDIAPSDAYQMYAYANVYKADVVALLYPKHARFQSINDGVAEWRLQPENQRLCVASIDLEDEEKSVSSIAALSLIGSI